MRCNFLIRPKQDIAEIYEIALKEIKRFNAKYDGDVMGGQFEVEILRLKFKGKVTVEGKVLHVAISDKPLLISCSLIETGVKQYVRNLTVKS